MCISILGNCLVRKIKKSPYPKVNIKIHNNLESVKLKQNWQAENL